MTDSSPPQPGLSTPQATADCATLVRWLAEHEERCPVCQYGLRGLVVARCPECGHDLELGVRAPRLRLLPWAGLVAFICMALGFDGVVALVITVVLIRAGPPPGSRPWIVYFSMVGASLLMGTLLWLVLARRVKFLSLPAAVQARAALAGGAIIFVAHAVLGMWFAGLI